MRTLRLATVSAAIVGLLAAATSTAAQADDPTLTLSHDAVSPGYGFFVSGTGCVGEFASVKVDIDGAVSDKLPDSDGNWKALGSAPLEGSDPITVRAVCQTPEGAWAYAPATVTISGTDLGLGPVLIPPLSGDETTPAPTPTRAPAKPHKTKTTPTKKADRPALPSTGW